VEYKLGLPDFIHHDFGYRRIHVLFNNVCLRTSLSTVLNGVPTQHVPCSDTCGNWFEGGPGIRTVPPAPKATAAIFCTYPQPFVTKASQFFSEFIASALLMFVIFALKDPSNNGVGKVGTPFSSLAAPSTYMLLERQMVPTVFVLPHLWARRVFRLRDRIRD
jgi:glycerol uptake facilitator-like aquaporin